jgi:hypothetical protein
MKSIIELAKQAGFGIDESPCVLQPYVIQPLHGKIDDELTRFAHLVRQQVLEEAAGVCDPEPSLPNEAYTVHNNKVTMRRCAAAIRALKTGEAK